MVLLMNLCRPSTSCIRSGVQRCLNTVNRGAPLQWGDDLIEILAEDITKEEQAALKKDRPWASAYLQCLKDPKLSLIITYNYDKKYTKQLFWPDQLRAVYYAILWAHHNNQDLVTIEVNNNVLVDTVLKYKPRINAEEVLNLRHVINTSSTLEKPMQVKLVHRDFPWLTTERPPADVEKITEKKFLDLVKNSSDIINSKLPTHEPS